MLERMGDWARDNIFPDIVLFPYVPMILIDMLRDNGLNSFLVSRFVGGIEGNVILSKTIKGVVS